MERESLYIYIYIYIYIYNIPKHEMIGFYANIGLNFMLSNTI